MKDIKYLIGFLFLAATGVMIWFLFKKPRSVPFEPPIDEPPIDEPPIDEPPIDEPPIDVIGRAVEYIVVYLFTKNVNTNLERTTEKRMTVMARSKEEAMQKATNSLSETVNILVDRFIVVRAYKKQR